MRPRPSVDCGDRSAVTRGRFDGHFGGSIRRRRLYRRLKARSTPKAVFDRTALRTPHGRDRAMRLNCRVDPRHRLGHRADAILRSCVHCGFCNATCPTYLLPGDELDGPRGRIYLIKDMLEADAPTGDRARTPRPLPDVSCVRNDLSVRCRLRRTRRNRPRLLETRDRARSCRPRSARGRCGAWCRRRVGSRFSLGSDAHFAGCCPAIPRARGAADPRRGRPAAATTRARVVLLDGCVQQVDDAGGERALARAARRRRRRGRPRRRETCCGSLALHLGTGRSARDDDPPTGRAVRAAAGAEAIVSTASGCGVTVKDYGRLLADDPLTPNARAGWRTTPAMRRSTSRGLDAELARRDPATTVAWHAPCTLQHGQRVNGVVEGLLRRAGYRAGAGARCASLLRLGRHLLDSATGARR